MRKVIVMSGIPGSGKSTYAREMCDSHAKEHGAVSVGLISTDDYFMVDGKYMYDATKIGAAHADCFRRFIDCMRCPVLQPRLVVVDNTNTTAMELAPYILGANAFKWESEVRTIVCENEHDMKVAAARNSHNVPFGVVISMWRNLHSRRLPPYWKNTNIPMHV